MLEARVATGRDLSIVIPALNEADFLDSLLPYLIEIAPEAELVIADGGSTDGTREIASQYGKVVISPRGRGQQLNFGAACATRDVLWFLHADCRPHKDSVKAIESSLMDGSYRAGGFEYEFFEPDWRFRLLAWHSNIKNRIKRQLYGDMGIFVRRELFFRMKGFRQAHLMEDFDFGRRLRRQGQVVILPLKMQTSSRDWHRTGIIRKIIKDAFIRTAFLMKTDERTLYRWYYGSQHELEE